jgi:hypothetical protein
MSEEENGRRHRLLDLDMRSDQIGDLMAANLEFRALAIKRSPRYVEA